VKSVDNNVDVKMHYEASWTWLRMR